MKGIQTHLDTIRRIVEMSQNGHSKKEIANVLGIGYSTVCTYLQQKSKWPDDVKAMMGMTGTAISFAPKVEIINSAPEKAQEEEMETMEKVQILPVISIHSVKEMQGKCCVYRTDTQSTSIELLDKNGGTLTGIVDADDIPSIIAELQALMIEAKKF